MSEAMLTVERLSAWYGAARILYDLSFEVGRGEVVALMGRNGAGKSTTMKTIMGLMAKRQGRVCFNGEDISGRKPFEIARRGLGFALWSPDPEASNHPLGERSFGHTGFTGTSLWIDPDRSLVLACLTNRVYYGRAARASGAWLVGVSSLFTP